MRSNRLNQNGLVENLRFIMKIDVNLFGLCDYLWNSGYLETLFLELFRLHEYQITKVCEVYRQKYVQIYSETKYMVLFEIIFNGEFDVESISIGEMFAIVSFLGRFLSRIRNMKMDACSCVILSKP